VFLDQSISFAGKVQQEFKTIGRYDRGVKQAGFLVLYKTTMPSVLIETGFLTNPLEEKFLASKEQQQKMADAMFTAFKNYKNELEGINVGKNETFLGKIEEKKEKEKAKTIPIPSKSNDVIFRVQIVMSPSQISLTDPRFRGMEVFEYEQSGAYKYTIGAIENDVNAANDLKNELRNNGFKDAFVVAFVENERISLEKAIKLAEK
jgi:N-acetylmuramoyl-L-alanine amidase